MVDRKMPDVIIVSQVGGEYSLTIDGVEFPWWIAAGDDAPQVGRISRENGPTLTVTLMANRVEATHGIS